MDTPNKAEFSINEKPREYSVRFSVTGEIRTTIMADSLEEAKAKAEAMIEEDGFGTEIDEPEDIRVDHVWKSPPMFRVTREGHTMQVSHLLPGDMPRQPTDHEF